MALLFIAACGWKTEYDNPVSGTAVVVDNYHRSAYSTYMPPVGKHGIGHWTHHPARWSITILVNDINQKYTLDGEYVYHTFPRNSKLNVTYRKVWSVKYKKNSNIEEKREFKGYELLTYSQ